MIDTNKIRNTLKKAEKLAEIYECKLNLGFSGGKDSVVLKYFAEYYGIDYVAHFNNTQIEQYKGMIRFIRSNYPDVHIVHPDRENSFFELMKKKGLPSLFRRWCCESLKHSNPKLAEYRVNIMGVRGEESANRMKRGAISVFGKSKRSQKASEKLKAIFALTDSQIQCECSQIIEPYYFGDPYKKRTCLWLKNLSELKYYKDDLFEKGTMTEPTHLFVGCSPKRKRKLPVLISSGHKERSKFHPGIAKAMAQQWTEYINNNLNK